MQRKKIIFFISLLPCLINKATDNNFLLKYCSARLDLEPKQHPTQKNEFKTTNKSKLIPKNLTELYCYELHKLIQLQENQMSEDMFKAPSLSEQSLCIIEQQHDKGRNQQDQNFLIISQKKDINDNKNNLKKEKPKQQTSSIVPLLCITSVAVLGGYFFKNSKEPWSLIKKIY